MEGSGFRNICIYTDSDSHFGAMTKQAFIVEFAGDFASTVGLNWKMWILCIILGSIRYVTTPMLRTLSRRLIFLSSCIY